MSITETRIGRRKGPPGLQCTWGRISVQLCSSQAVLQQQWQWGSGQAWELSPVSCWAQGWARTKNLEIRESFSPWEKLQLGCVVWEVVLSLSLEGFQPPWYNALRSGLTGWVRWRGWRRDLLRALLALSILYWFNILSLRRTWKCWRGFLEVLITDELSNWKRKEEEDFKDLNLLTSLEAG